MPTSTVYVIDARSRKMLVYTASATTLSYNSNAMVLRKGVTIGEIATLCGRRLDYPTLVVGSYSAKQSCGFVTPMGGDDFYKVDLVGGAGFGREVEGVRRGDALRPFPRPVQCVLMPKGIEIKKIETYAGSNRATADAVLEGLKMMASTRTFILAEGQSDRTTAFSFNEARRRGVKNDCEEVIFPIEHRKETFSPKALIMAAVSAATRFTEDSPEKHLSQKNIYLSVLLSKENTGSKVVSECFGVPKRVKEFLGGLYKPALQELVVSMKTDGWKVAIDLTYGNRFTQATSPQGEVFRGNAVFDDPSTEQDFISSGDNTPEEKEKILSQIREEQLQNS